jgi:CDGSH-type Zn-finger protein
MKFPLRSGEEPLPVNLEEGKRYAWCTCGLSEKQPLCDGKHKAHKGLRSQVFIADKSETRYLCCCKQTKNPPYCDGSHSYK